MPDNILLYIGAALPILWGAAHLFPTANIVKGFGDISADNKNIITMEWIIEGVALIFIGVITFGVTVIEEAGKVSDFIYLVSASILVVLALISLFTGFKVKFILFKVCPFLFTVSALLIFFGR